MTSLRTVAGGTYLDAVFACEGRGSIEIALEDATAALPSPGLPDTRQLGAVETSCSTEPEGLTLRGPERDAAIGIVVSAPEDARYWVVVGAPTEETRP